MNQRRKGIVMEAKKLLDIGRMVSAEYKILCIREYSMDTIHECDDGQMANSAAS